MKKKINKKAIIGHTGFIGSILKKKNNKHELFNSINITSIQGKQYDEIICAGLPATKWLINKFPNQDLKNTNILIKNLKLVNCRLFILISTIDIHNNNDHYGKNRKKFEEFVKKNFKKFIIIRLPAVFGTGLKKNILFDLLNNNQIEKINPNDQFQWFDVELLNYEIQKIKKLKKFNRIIEFYSPPISNEKIIKEFPKYGNYKTNKEKIIYDYKPSNGYYKNENFILRRIKTFIKNYEQ